MLHRTEAGRDRPSKGECEVQCFIHHFDVCELAYTHEIASFLPLETSSFSFVHYSSAVNTSVSSTLAAVLP